MRFLAWKGMAFVNRIGEWVCVGVEQWCEPPIGGVIVGSAEQRQMKGRCRIPGLPGVGGVTDVCGAGGEVVLALGNAAQPSR